MQRRTTRAGRTCAPGPHARQPDISRQSRALRTLMSAQVGVIRDAAGLAGALTEILRMEREATSPGEKNAATAALLAGLTTFASTPAGAETAANDR